MLLFTLLVFAADGTDTTTFRSLLSGDTGARVGDCAVLAVVIAASLVGQHEVDVSAGYDVQLAARLAAMEARLGITLDEAKQHGASALQAEGGGGGAGGAAAAYAADDESGGGGGGGGAGTSTPQRLAMTQSAPLGLATASAETRSAEEP